MNRKAWLFAVASLVTGMAQATCYSVHRSDGALLLESPTTPVNLTLPLGDTVPEKFGPGAFMTMSDLGVFCKPRRLTPGPQKVVAAAAPVKQREEVKAQAPVERQPTDEELLALKPDEAPGTVAAQQE